MCSFAEESSSTAADSTSQESPIRRVTRSVTAGQVTVQVSTTSRKNPVRKCCLGFSFCQASLPHWVFSCSSTDLDCDLSSLVTDLVILLLGDSGPAELAVAEEDPSAEEDNFACTGFLFEFGPLHSP